MSVEPSRDTAAAVRLVVRAELKHVSDIRHRLRSMVLDAGDSDTVADDIAIVASELSTNVVQYTGTDTFTVQCTRAGDDDAAWILEISHAHGLDLDAPVSGTPNSQGGRGLMIVRALMDSVEVVDGDDGPAIRCVKSVG